MNAGDHRGAMGVRGQRLLLAFLFTCGGTLGGCAERSLADSKADSHESAAPAAPVARVAREDLVNTLQIASVFLPFQEVDVLAKVAGYIQTIRVDIGDAVHTGEVMAVLEVPELEQDLAQARAAKRRYQDELKRVQSEIRRFQAIQAQMRITYDRMASVNERTPHLVAQQDIDVAHAQATASEADVSAREAALLATEHQLTEAEAAEKRALTLAEYAKILAPFDGVVTRRFADTGAMIAMGTNTNLNQMPVVRVAQVDPLRLSFPVPESVIPVVQVGASVQINVPALKKTLEAKIWRFTGKAEDATRTMETQVLLSNSTFEVKPGMLASVILTLGHREHVLAVPLDAVASPEAHPSVLVVKENKIEERNIALGLQTPTKFEVTSGLTEGELVIVANRSAFTPGQTVHPKLVPSDPKN